MKNYLKKIDIFYFTIGILISISGYYKFYYQTNLPGNLNSLNNNTTQEVISSDLTQTIDTYGSAELINEQQLKFGKNGTVKKVFFKDGDSIKSGDIIASLDSTDQDLVVEDAKISLENAKLSLSELYNKDNKSQILQAQNNIKTQEFNLDIAKKELENLKITQTNSINDLKQNIENAKNDLEISKKSYDLALSDASILKDKLNTDYNSQTSQRENSIFQIQTNIYSEKTNILKSLDDIDKILGQTDKNRDLNNDFEIYLGAKNTSIKNEAENNLLKTYGLYNDFLNNLNDFENKKQDLEYLKILLGEISNIYKNLSNTSDLTYQTRDNSISTSTFSQTQIDQIKSNMLSIKQSSESKSISNQNTVNTINNLTNLDNLNTSNNNQIEQKNESLKSQKNSLEQKQNQLKTLENNLKNTLFNNEISLENKLQSIENLKNQIEIAKQNLDDLITGPTNENIKKAQNNITSASNKLENALKGYKDYNIIAPFDGIVRKNDFLVGDTITSSDTKYVYIENPNLIQIPISLDQIDIVKVELNTPVKITFDAYPSKKLNGIISSIDLTPIKNSGVVSYTAYITLDKNNQELKDLKIISGMTANIEIITSSKENVLVVSSGNIFSKNNKTYVNLLKNGEKIQTEVKTGITANGKTEIISGLNKGDKISVIEVKSSTNSNSPNSLFLSPGGSRGGGGFGTQRMN
ncbi:HlyD family efflux transporter periplasmic adaptor subunit [Candidatus Gracilibacteria bacterium]|nr:HlyD family efflux transporter periplasmic adaptor subunit [Candidatus Gracilibacteria bacterium]